ncbi:MAG: ribonuclease III [Synergistaceae bacterium]
MDKLIFENELKKFQTKIGYVFSNEKLLEEALTHSSYANELGCSFFNERLEFLGDAVLELVTSERLYYKEKQLDEGKLTLLRSQLVCKKSLCNWAKIIGLNEIIKLGKSLRNTGATDSICADALEAVFGAIFLDSSFEDAKIIIENYLDSQLNISPDNLDPKTELQQLLQGKGMGVPYYKTIDKKGPDHALKFKVAITLNNNVIAEAWGNSIKEAEFNVAQYILENNILKIK